MENKEQNFLSAVIYVHNAEQEISHFLQGMIALLEEHFEHAEIICVNDSSDDGSLAMIRQTGQMANRTSVSVVNMSYFHGLELAMNAGVDLAIGDYVMEFDRPYADYDWSMVMEVYKKALEGYDIVSASPDRRQRLSSRLFYRLFARFANLSYEMTTESFRILSRRVINRIGSMNKTVYYRKAMYANSGLMTANIRYPAMAETRTVSDKREKRYRTRLAVDSLILFTEMGYRFSMWMTMAMMLMTMLIVCYTMITYLTRNPVAGWTTTILFLSICFFGLFGIQTIIVKYLQLLVDMVFRRKHYSFESLEKLTK